MPKSQKHKMILHHIGNGEEACIEDFQKACHNRFTINTNVKTKSHLKTIQRLKEKLKNKNN